MSASPAETPAPIPYLGVDMGSLRTRITLMNPEKPLPSIVRNALSNESTATIASFPPMPVNALSRGRPRLYGENAAPKAITQPHETVTDMVAWLLESTETSIVACSSAAGEEKNYSYTSYRSFGNKTVDIESEDPSEGAAVGARGPNNQLHVVQVVSYYLRNILLLSSSKGENMDAREASAFLSTVRLAAALPPFASPFARRAYRQAAVLAGVKDENVVIVSADEAAALYFHHHQYNRLLGEEQANEKGGKKTGEGASSLLSPPSLVIIVNIGACSIFATLLHVTSTSVRKIATECLSQGASELDKELTDFIFSEVEKKFGAAGAALRYDLKTCRKLEQRCRKAKEVISANDRYHLRVECLLNDTDFDLEVTKEKLESVASPFLISLTEMLTILKQKQAAYLASLNLPSHSDIPVRVEMIGGGWRTTCVTNAVKSALGVERLGTSLDANLAVSEGCSLFSFFTFAATEKDKEALTVLPHRVHVLGFDEFPDVEGGKGLSGHVPLLTEEEKAAVSCWSVEEEKFAEKDEAIHNHLIALNQLDSLVLQTLSVLSYCKMEESKEKSARDYLLSCDDYIRNEVGDAKTEDVQAKVEEVKHHLQENYPEIDSHYLAQKAEEERKTEELARLSREKKEEEDPKSDPQRLRLAQKRREQGTVLFKEECWAEAQTRFVQALALLGQLYDTTSEENKKKKDEISLSCYLNSASCAVRLGIWRNAINNCSYALEVSPENPKAYFRRGQAYMGMKDYTEAVKDLEKALKLSQQDAGVLAALNEAKRCLNEEKKREKKMFSKMFA